MSEFDWDEANVGHVARHSVLPEEAEQVIENEPIDLDFETVEGEDRITSFGRTNRGRFLVAITTMRGTRIRIVTAFTAPERLVELYLRTKEALNQ